MKTGSRAGLLALRDGPMNKGDGLGREYLKYNLTRLHANSLRAAAYACVWCSMAACATPGRSTYNQTCVRARAQAVRAYVRERVRTRMHARASECVHALWPRA